MTSEKIAVYSLEKWRWHIYNLKCWGNVELMHQSDKKSHVQFSWPLYCILTVAFLTHASFYQEGKACQECLTERNRYQSLLTYLNNPFVFSALLSCSRKTTSTDVKMTQTQQSITTLTRPLFSLSKLVLLPFHLVWVEWFCAVSFC